MKTRIGKRLLSILLAAVMCVQLLPVTAMASLLDNSADRNREILEELTAFWGDENTAEEAMRLLREYGLIDEKGNALTDWSDEIYIQEETRALTFAEARALRSGTVTVNGRACGVSELNGALDTLEELGLLPGGVPAGDWQLKVDGEAAAPAGLEAVLAAREQSEEPSETPSEEEGGEDDAASDQTQLSAEPVVTVRGEKADTDILLEAISFLEQYGLLTENGALTNWDLTQPGGARKTNVTELLAMLEDEDADRNLVITVDGTDITLGDFETMMQIEAEIRRIQDTYMQDDVELTPEQASSLYSLYEQLSAGDIMLYNTQGADDLEFPSELNHNARVSVSVGNTNTGGDVKLNWSVTNGDKVTFDVRILDGSATATFSGNQKTASCSGTSGNQTITVAKLNPALTGTEYWYGDRVVFVQAYNIKGALFSNGKDSITLTIRATNNTKINQSLPVTWSADSTKNNGTATETLSDGLRFLLRKGIINVAKWEITTSGYKKDTCFAKGAVNEKLDGEMNHDGGFNNIKNITPFYYQYLQAAGYASNKIIFGKEVGYADSVYTTLGLNKIDNNGSYLSSSQNSDSMQAKYYNYNDQQKANAVPRANNSNTTDSVKGTSGTIDTAALSACSSIALKAKGKWEAVGSGYEKYYSSYSGSTVKVWGISYAPKNGSSVSVKLTATLNDTKEPTVSSVKFPTGGSFPSGAQVPVTVKFSEPVVSKDVKIVANGTTLSPVEKSDTICDTLNFLYPVKTSDNRFIEVTKVSGAKDIKGNTMKADDTKRKSDDILDKTPRLRDAISTLESNVGEIKYTPAQSDIPEKTTAAITVSLPLPSDTKLRNLLTPIDSDGNSTVLQGGVKIGGEIQKLPFRLDNPDDPKCLLVEFEIDAADLIDRQNFVMELWDMEADEWFFGKYASFSTKKPVPLTAGSLSIQTPSDWPTAPIYVNDPPEASALTLKARVNAPAGTTWTQTRWVSGDETIATIDDNGTIYPLAAGKVEFYLEAVNGNLEVYGGERSRPVTLTIQEGAAPYLRIPESQMTIRSGDPVTLRWASNLVQKNAEYGDNAATAFTIQVFNGTDTSGTPVQTKTVTYDPADKSDTDLWVNGSPNQSFTLTGLNQTSVGFDPSYTIVLSAQADSGVPSAQSEYTAEATVFVVSQPVSVHLVRPDNLYRTNGQSALNVKYTLDNFDAGNNADFELVVTNNATGQTVTTIEKPDTVNGGSFTINLSDAEIRDNFRTIYDVSIKAKNTAEKDWSRDSFTLYIYDEDCLDILVQPVTKGGKSTVSVSGDSVKMSNEDWIASLPQEKILALNRDIDLQTVISINYGEHAWGEARDRIQWASQNSSVAAVNYPQAAYYENIEDLPYVSFAPATQFLLSGKNSGKTVVQAIHALAGNALSSSANITVETLKDKLYLFQFYPASPATLSYTNGKGEQVERKTESDGRAAVYEPSGIASNVYVKAEIGGDVYLGTVYKEDLVSQEKDAVSLELYPLNSLTLRKAATLPVYLKKPDGTNYSGTMRVRAGVYRNGEYCESAYYATAPGADISQKGDEDHTVTFDADGKATFYFDLTQFSTASQPNAGTDNPVTAADDIQFVLELQSYPYYPTLFTASGTTNEDDAIRMSERIVNLEEASNYQRNKPFVAQQVAYYSETETGFSTDLRNRNGKFGPSKDYPDILLSTTVLWWGEKENDDPNRYNLLYMDDCYQLLSGQEVSSVRYPFCSMPVTTNTVRLNQAQFDSLRMDAYDMCPIVLKYIKDYSSVKSEQMRWTLLNALQLDSAIQSQSLLERLGALKQIMADSNSDGVSVQDDFLTFGIKLATATGINLPFLKLQLAPTNDPTKFRGLVYMGLNNFEDDNVSGVAADSSRRYDADYFPGLEQVKGLFKQGRAYGQTMATQMSYAKQLLANNFRQGSGTSKTGDSKIKYALQGYFETEVYYDFNDKEWKMVVVTGGFTAGGGFGYEWTWNTQVGPVPIFFQLEGGAAGAIEMMAAVDSTRNDNDYLTELRLYAYLQAFGGVGFDYSVIALKVGLYGQIGVEATVRWLNAINKDLQLGASLNVTGEIGVRFQVEILFFSYELVLWSQPVYKYSGATGKWEAIGDYWTRVQQGNSGDDPIIWPGSQSSSRMRARLVSEDSSTGTGVYTAERDAALLDRDYLSEYQRSYDSSGPSLGGGISLFSLFSGRENKQIVETVENSYPLAAPVLSDDGKYLFYLDDNGDASDATNVRAAVMTRNGSSGYASREILDNNGYGDSGLKAAGSGDNAVAVWSRVTEKPAITEPGQSITPDIQAAMLGSSDIMAAVRSGSGWTVTNLTENNNAADLSPVVAANGKRILVAWRQVASSDATNLTIFDARDYIYYSVSEDGGESWTTPEAIYNGTSGAVKGIEAAMLDSGAAAVTFILQTGNDSYSQEIAYAIVDEDGNDGFDVVRYVQITDDDNLDENPQITAVQMRGEEIFVLGWHCLENGEGDIRLAAVDQNGDRVTGFVDALSSLIQNTDTGISANFQFSRSADSLDNLSILWSDTAAEDAASEKPTHDYLSALRFRTENDQGVPKISVTAAQKIAEMGDYTTIDNFSAYVAKDGTLYAAMQGTYYDYNNLKTYTVTYGDGETNTVSVASEKTSIFTAAGVYTDTLRVDSVIPDYANIRKGTSLPVQISVTNLGTQPMKQVAVKIGGQETSFAENANSAFVAIAPGETRSLTAFYTVPAEGAVPNPSYTITGTFEDGWQDVSDPQTLTLNVPDLGIADSNILFDAVDGDRILQFNLYNLSDAALAGSGRSVKFNLYSDAACTGAIDPKYLTLRQAGGSGRSGEALLTVSGNDLSAIDEGSYTLQYVFDLETYMKDEKLTDSAGEVCDNGVTIYAKAWIELADGGEMLEYVSSNNVTPIKLESLLKQADGEPTTVTSVLSSTDTGSTVEVTLQNNSMVQKPTGNVIVTLMDENNNVLEQQQTYTGDESNNGLITLNTEERTTLPVFTFSQQGAAALVTYSDAKLTMDASLDDLTFSNIPGVAADQFKEDPKNPGTYCFTIPTDDLTGTGVTFSTQSPRATVKVELDGEEVAAENAQNARNLKLTPGKSHTVTITVTDGSEKKIYRLVINNNGAPTITGNTTTSAGSVGEFGTTVFYAESEVVLQVAATANVDYDLSYQWYQCDDAERKNPQKIDDATGQTLTIPNPTNVGTYYYFCKVGRKLLDDTIKEYDSSVATVVINKATDNAVIVSEPVEFTFDNQPHSLTVSAAKTNSTLWYSTDLTNEDGWSEENPSFISVGVHPVYIKATNSNYEDTEVFGTNVIIKEAESTQYKVELKTLQNAEQEAALKQSLTNLGFGSSSVWDGELYFKLEGSEEWIQATSDNIPADRVTVKIPYPEGVSRSKYRFTLNQMVSDPLNSGKEIGTIETLNVELRVDGIYFTTDCVGALALGWRKRPSGPAATYPVSASDEKHGSVTVSPEKASSGTAVTITAKPDDGYQVDDVTVIAEDGRKLAVKEKGDNVYTFTMPNGAVRVEVDFAPLTESCSGGKSCPSRAYTDLDITQWYHEATDYVLTNGLMSGTGANTFAPNTTLSRAMIAQILYNQEGRPAVSGKSAFTDMANGEWYTNAIIWASENNIVSGYPNGSYGPNDPITREQLASILYRYAGSPDVSGTLNFSDAQQANNYALDALKWATQTGVMSGVGGRTLNPTGSATRAQVAQMLKNLLANTR